MSFDRELVGVLAFDLSDMVAGTNTPAIFDRQGIINMPSGRA